MAFAPRLRPRESPQLVEAAVELLPALYGEQVRACPMIASPAPIFPHCVRVVMCTVRGLT